MTPHPFVEESDFDALLELLEANTMREVVTMFALSAPERLVAVRDGVRANDPVSVATAFHTMRSGCGQLGARHLEELCAHAERVAKTGDLAAVQAMMTEVSAELDGCLGWFSERGWVNP